MEGSKRKERVCIQEGQDLQAIIAPLDFFDYVQGAVNYELIHVSSLFAKSSDAVSASFGCTKLMLEQWVVSRSDDGEVIRHLSEAARRSPLRLPGVQISRPMP